MRHFQNTRIRSDLADAGAAFLELSLVDQIDLIQHHNIGGPDLIHRQHLLVTAQLANLLGIDQRDDAIDLDKQA